MRWGSEGCSICVLCLPPAREARMNELGWLSSNPARSATPRTLTVAERHSARATALTALRWWVGNNYITVPATSRALTVAERHSAGAPALTTLRN